MSQQESKRVSVQEYVQTLRGQIVLSYDSAKETALRNFDDMTKKYVEQLQLAKEKETAKATPKVKEIKKK